MGRKLSLVSSVLFFLLLIANVSAVTFTVTASPSSGNAGNASQLVNFTVADTGSVNITTLNITLPQGFTFTGTSGTTTASPYTASTSSPSWTNTSSRGLVGNGATEYFWVYVSSASSTGTNFGFNITVMDANGAFSSNNATFTLYDIIPPTYTSNITSPVSNSSYAPNQTYFFNVTWSDNVAVSKALVEHNFTTGSIHNETMNVSGSVYYWNQTDLPGGTYVWRSYANDTNNTFNSTAQYTYIIQKASDTLNVFLNGSKNSNISAFNNTAVNITTTASCTQPACTFTVLRDGSSIASGASNPYSNTNDVITSIGLHNYTVTVAGNTNYTSTTATYYIGVTPTYTTSTSFPSAYTNTTLSYVNITFSSPPSFDNNNITLESNWAGTPTNYSMVNFSTTTYSYNATMPAGTFYWKLYASYSNYTFVVAPATSFTISQGGFGVSLSIIPASWTVGPQTQTNVSCVANMYGVSTLNMNGVTVALYRNGTAVSNPDIATFPVGVYAYYCNTTATQNFTSVSTSNFLTVNPTPVKTLSFAQFPTTLTIVQNSTASTTVIITNTGTLSQDVNLNVSGIDNTWYGISPLTSTILPGINGSFVVLFSVTNAEVNDYAVSLSANSSNATISKNFTLRVLPSDATKAAINDSLAVYRLQISTLETTINQLKNQTLNTSAVEASLAQLKSTLSQTDTYISTGDYFNANLNIQKIKAAISDIQSQIKKLTEPTITNLPQNVWAIIIGVVVVVVLGFVAYLFWPVKEGYNPQKEEYSKGKPGLWTKIKNFFSRQKPKKELEIKES